MHCQAKIGAAEEAAEMMVVENDRLHVAAELDIAFDVAGTGGSGRHEGRQRVLLRIRLITAMGDQPLCGFDLSRDRERL